MAQRYNILFGGAAGQGPNILTNILGKGLVKLGYYVFYTRDYQSLIRGGHNFNVLTFSEEPVNSNDSEIDIIVALDENTEKIHKKDLKKVIETKTGITNVGIDRFAEILVFIENFETLGLEIEEIQQLDEIRTLLYKLGIEPERLKKQIQNRIFQESQSISRSNHLNDLKNRTIYFQHQEQLIKSKCRSLFNLDTILTFGYMYGPCPQCKSPIIYPLEPQKTINHRLNLNQWVPVYCPPCGVLHQIHPMDLVNAFGWNLMPKDYTAWRTGA